MQSIFDISDLVFDFGNKYEQNFGPHTQTYNIKSQKGKKKVSRMEDYATVTKISEKNKFPISVVTITDGHGSSPAYSVTGNQKEAEKWIGGFETAKHAAECIQAYIQRVAQLLPLYDLEKNAMARIICDAYSYAQAKCEQETCKGARSVNFDENNQFPPERIEQLISSKIDGSHFRDIFQNSNPNDNPWMDPKHLIADKIEEAYFLKYPVPQNSFIISYIDGNEQNKHIAEHGCTATTAIFVPRLDITHDNYRGDLFLGHVGDTDAYIFYKQAQNEFQFLKITGNHTTSNQAEIDRLKKFGLEVNAPYFTLKDGEDILQMIMPSRSIGHILLSKHGISCEPTIATTKLSKGDIVVIATDGLWQNLGTVLKFKQRYSKGSSNNAHLDKSLDKLSPEDLSAYFVCQLLAENQNLSASQLAELIKNKVEKSLEKRDNLMIVAVKVL